MGQAHSQFYALHCFNISISINIWLIKFLLWDLFLLLIPFFFLFPLFPTFLFLKNSSPAFSRSLLFSVSSPISRTKVSLAWSNSRQDPTSGPQVTTGAYSPDTHSLAKPQVKGSNQTADKSLLFIMYIIVWLLSIWLKKKKKKTSISMKNT